MKVDLATALNWPVFAVKPVHICGFHWPFEISLNTLLVTRRKEGDLLRLDFVILVELSRLLSLN